MDPSIIAQKELQRRENEKYFRTPGGGLYQKFLMEYPQYTDIGRWQCEEWGFYIMKHSEKFQSDLNIFINNLLPYSEDYISHIKTLFNDYMIKSREKGFWKLNEVEAIIKSNHGEEAIIVWRKKRYIESLKVPEFPKFNFEYPCTNFIKEAKVSQSEQYYEKCLEWFNNNKQVILSQLICIEEDYKKNKLIEEKQKKEVQDKKEIIINNLLLKLDNKINRQEAEAILAKWYNADKNVKNMFQENSLLAIKSVNRFAEENKIRIEDSIDLFKEYCDFKSISSHKGFEIGSFGERIYIRG